jgi:signal transduction histidine kinase
MIGLCVAGALLLSASAVAGKALDVAATGPEPAMLTEYFEVLEDPSGSLTIADVQSAATADRFIGDRKPAPALNFGFTRSAFWLRLALRNPSTEPVTRLLEVGYPILSDIQLYRPGEDGTHRALKSGVVEPFSTRPYPSREFVFPVTLAPDSSQVVYLRVQSTSAMLIPARLWEPQAFRTHERSDYSVQAWYFGMATALILFNLLLSVALRDVVYLLYAAFVSGTALTIAASNGWGKEFLWPETSLWSDIAITVLGCFTVAALVLFMRRLLGTRESVPRADRLLKALIAVQLLFPIVVALAPQAAAVPGAVLLTAAGWFIVFVAGYCAVIQRQRLAMLFLAAYSMWWAGVGLVGLKTIAVLPANALTMNGYQIGSALEMLLLALALAYRFDLIRTRATEYVKQANERLTQRLQEREAELTAVHERLREAERRQTLIQERQRLMQDMHDGVGSSLNTALRVVERGQMDDAEVAEVLRGCIDDLKLAIDSMEPVDADLLLLLATLRFRLGPRLESTGIALRWEVNDLPALDWLDPRNSLHILRILQEAITNIIKHANATEVRLGTTAGADGVTVTLIDNGTGFDFEAELVSGGKGLSNQIRRAQAIGAEIRWTSDRSGTRLTLWLPYHRGSDEPSKTTASEERSKKASAPAPQPATVQYR